MLWADTVLAKIGIECFPVDPWEPLLLSPRREGEWGSYHIHGWALSGSWKTGSPWLCFFSFCCLHCILVWKLTITHDAAVMLGTAQLSEPPEITAQCALYKSGDVTGTITKMAEYLDFTAHELQVNRPHILQISDSCLDKGLHMGRKQLTDKLHWPSFKGLNKYTMESPNTELRFKIVVSYLETFAKPWLSDPAFRWDGIQGGTQGYWWRKITCHVNISINI